MNILKKAAKAVKKAVTPKKGKKKSSVNTGRSWKMDRIWASSQDYEQAYKPKRKKAYKTRTKK